MKRTLLSFASVIGEAIALLPMLVETGQLSAQAPPEPAAQVIQLVLAALKAAG